DRAGARHGSAMGPRVADLLASAGESSGPAPIGGGQVVRARHAGGARRRDISWYLCRPLDRVGGLLRGPPCGAVVPVHRLHRDRAATCDPTSAPYAARLVVRAAAPA